VTAGHVIPACISLCAVITVISDDDEDDDSAQNAVHQQSNAEVVQLADDSPGELSISQVWAPMPCSNFTSCRELHAGQVAPRASHPALSIYMLCLYTVLSAHLQR